MRHLIRKPTTHQKPEGRGIRNPGPDAGRIQGQLQGGIGGKAGKKVREQRGSRTAIGRTVVLRTAGTKRPGHTGDNTGLC